VVVLVLQAPDGSAPYMGDTHTEDGTVYWNVTNYDTAQVGYGKGELRLVADNVVVKSYTFDTYTKPSILMEASDPPAPVPEWATDILESAVEAQTAAAAAKESAEDADGYAASAASASESAAQSASSAVDTLAEVVTAGERAVANIQTEETTQAAALVAEGDAQVARIAAEGVTQVGAVEAKGAEVIASLPDDYVDTVRLVQTKMDKVGSYTKLALESASGMWNFSTGAVVEHASRKYIRYDIPEGVVMLGVRGYQFTSAYAAYGFYTSDNTLIYASDLANNTDMADATPVAVPDGATVLYVNIGTADTRGVWSFAAADVKSMAEQGLRMSDVSVNNRTQFDAVFANSNIDNAVNGLVYLIGFTPTVEDFATMPNMPARSSGVLMTLTKNAGYDIGKVQLFYATNGASFVRAKTTSVWREWSQMSEAVYYVGPTRSYTSLVGLLKRIQTDTFEKTIYLDPGTYDIFADYVANGIPTPPPDVATDDYFDYNVFLPQHTRLIGIGSVTLEFLPTPAQIDAATSKTWSVLNLWYGWNTVENLTIHCKNVRYAIHDDPHSEYSGFTNIYRNVRIIAEAHDTGLGSSSATGFGFANQSSYIIEDCDWRSNTSGSAFYGHEGGQGGAQITVRNSIFVASNADRAVRFQTIRAQSALVAPVLTRLESCYIGGKIYLQSYRATSGQFFDITLLKSGNPDQIIDYADNPYPIEVFE
jgi:hypothetical protein